MRIWSLLVVGMLLLLTGCGGGGDAGPEGRARHASDPSGAVRSAGAARQPDPVPPPPRRIDCHRVECVSLTFDDGPGDHTARLLDTLKAAGVRATFFVLGEKVREYPDLVRRMALEGHEIANHSWSHARLTGLSQEGVRSQIRRTQEAVKEIAGVEPALMRPPYGATDERVARAVGLPQILWSVDTMDWLYRDAERGAKVGITEPGAGGIVLYHDIHKPTVDCIPEVLDGLKGRGFTLVTVGEMFQDEPLVPGETYTERPESAELLAASPPPPGSPAGPPETPFHER